MRRIGMFVAGFALLGGVAACGGNSGMDPAAARPSPIPETFVGLGNGRSPDPFTELGLDSKPLPGDAVLVGVHYSLALSRYAVAREVSADAVKKLRLGGNGAADGPWRAMDGQEFLLVHVADELPDRRVQFAPDKTTAAVLVDGQSRPFEHGVRPGMVIVVSVPIGKDARLAVTDAGQTQSISFRTGTRTDGSPASPGPGSQAPPTGEVRTWTGAASLNDYVQVAGYPSNRGDVLVGTSVKVTLRPYVDDRGWAKPGKLWAEIDVTVGLTVFDNLGLSIDLARSLGIRTAGGLSLPVLAGTVLRPVKPEIGPVGTQLAEWSEVFEVPEGTRKLSVTYRTKGSATDKEGDRTTFTRRDMDNSGTVTLT